MEYADRSCLVDLAFVSKTGILGPPSLTSWRFVKDDIFVVCEFLLLKMG